MAADEANAVALAHLRARARDRDFKKANLLPDARAKRDNAVGIAGTGADDDLAGRGR